MDQKQMQSVGDVAHLLDVHEQVVIAWAERNDLPRVGREFVLTRRDVRDFERWLKAADPIEDDGAGGDDAGDDDDDANPEGDEDSGAENDESEAGEDEDEDEDEGEDERD